MSEHDQPASDSSAEEPVGDARPSDGNSAGETRNRWAIWPSIRGLLLRAVAVLGAFFLLMVLLTGAAGWYTSRPQFCRSCHIMEPYYVSWEHSSHRDVSCIKCHFPPGVGEKVRGKLLGLVQLAKYVTSSEGPRPAAEIPDASCLRSGCHETRLLAGRVDFRGVPFDHAPHLEQLRRGKQLRCTSCHSQIVQGDHMTVTTSTCNLCHFKGGFFNEGLGACTRCHQIPDQEFELGGGVKFNHELAYEKGVDCASCHGDLIRGNGEVPSERCTVCHNREGDLERIDDSEFLHRTHVAEHKVDCLACHLEIHHTLDPHKISAAAADCRSCHPDHHREQVNMLEGTGGKLIPSHPSGMTAARIACPTCHRDREVSPTGTVLMKSSIQTCAACHESAEIGGLQSYHDQLKEAIVKLEADLPRVRGALETADLDEERKADVTLRLNDVEHDVHFLRQGNDIHNSHYADSLTKAVVAQLKSICGDLNIELPDVQLPETASPLQSASANPDEEQGNEASENAQ